MSWMVLLNYDLLCSKWITGIICGYQFNMLRVTDRTSPSRKRELAKVTLPGTQHVFKAWKCGVFRNANRS